MLSFKPPAHKKHHKRHSHNHGHLGGAPQHRDREHEMIKNRVFLVTFALSGSLIFGPDIELIYAFLAYLVSGLCLVAHYTLKPGQNNMRRFAGIIVDAVIGGTVFGIGGEHAAAFYPLYLWVILGNGFRFGVKWLFIAAAMISLSFATVIYFNAYWQSNLALAYGLLAGLIVIPAYCSTLITKLSQAKEEAEAANSSKTLFLASISHELRTPLNAIIGYGTHMLDMKLPDSQHKMVSTSVSAGRHLLHLINQLLSFAKSETEEELPKPTDFAIVNVMTDVRDIMQIAADEKGLDIHLQAEAMSDRIISGQEDYIRNILINLTSNAVKFTDTGSVTLKCGFTEDKTGRQLWCSVTDTGPGIAPEAQEKIFGVFQQADDTVLSRFGGTGLGLAICRQLAMQMDGDVALDSTIGEGSCFTLTCPVESITIDSTDSSDEVSKILSIGFGESPPEITDIGDHELVIDHIQCAENDSLETIVAARALNTYDLAILDTGIARQHNEDSPLWHLFREAKLAPVMLSSNSDKSLSDIKLRAAFASVLPVTPDFDSIRSVIQIGCSFNRTLDQDGDQTQYHEKAFVPQRILVADDNRTNQMVIETILTNAGHLVAVAGDGEQALQLLEDSDFDIVFLDVNMPKIDGIECCKLWRQIEGTRSHIPIVGLTADATEETGKKCLDAGMDLRLTKPIEAGLLLNTIAELTQDAASDENRSITDDPMGVVSRISGDSDAGQSPPINPTQLNYLRSIGDEDFVQTIIDAYIEDADEIMKSFQQSVANANVAEFRFHAHAFKSGANNVGATELSKICARLEVITENDFGKRRHEFFDRVREEVSRINRYFAEDYPLQSKPDEKTDRAAG